MVETLTKLGTWAGVFGRRSQLVKDIANDLRALVIGLHPDVTEVPRSKDKSVAYGLGEKRMSEAYCYLMPQTGHVNLGFFWGAKLDDPNGLLEGTGKKLRHIKIQDQETARSAKIAHMVYQAIEERRIGLADMLATKATKKTSGPNKAVNPKKSAKKGRT